jgi:uncharacterized protein YdeI (YjbR/CyaY-like superfamily)
MPTDHDRYIAKAPQFARPVLAKLRALMHEACPDIEETMKWGTPHFDYKGIVAGMAAFKAHIRFGFWKGKLLSDKLGILKDLGDTTMGAVKITSLDDLPADKVLIKYIKEAVKLNETGAAAPPRPRRKIPAKDTRPPADLLAAMNKNKKALATFESFPPSHRKEYVQWILDAKQEETRKRRIATAIEWMTEGKSKNWKYERK